MRSLFVCLGAVAWLSAGASSGDTIRFALPGWVELELVEVSGTSSLPLQYLYAGKNKENLTRVSAPTYWIGKFEVSQKQYAAVMGEVPFAAKDDRLPVTNVKWKDAVEFCNRLNHVVKGEIPAGYRFDLPTMVEWAHAYCGGVTNVCKYSGSDELDTVAWHGVGHENNTVSYSSLHLPGLKSANAIRAYDMSGNVAEYVFITDVKGGSVRMGGSYMWPERYCELCGSVAVAKDSVYPDLGFRVVLVRTAARDPDGKAYSMATKGRILLRSGCAALAREYLSEALGLDGLTSAEEKRLNDEWVKADLACGYDVGTWDELLTTLGVKLEGLGYQANEILRFWRTDPAAAEYNSLCTAAAKLYRREEIYGMRVNVTDLPKEVTDRIASKTAQKVQAVFCDFTGDGLGDLIVELAGQTDPAGDLYGFFERRREGGYVLVGEPIRTVGMCVIPASEPGKKIFIAMIKRTDEVLAPGALDCTQVDGKPCLRIAWPLERSYGLSELDKGDFDPRVPFMGKRNWNRIRSIAEGNYKRPLCWPWK